VRQAARQETAELEAGAPGWRQCQVFTSDSIPPADGLERCPNRAEALIWFSCPFRHEYTEEVCRGHVQAPGNQWCGACAKEGEQVFVAISFIGWI
jgi:hypothetical protein